MDDVRLIEEDQTRHLKVGYKLTDGLRPSPMYFSIFSSKIGKLYKRDEFVANVFLYFFL